MSPEAKHIDLFLKMLSISALSGQEGQRADLLEGYFREQKIPVGRVHNNLIIGDPEKKGSFRTLLLNSHIDTVPPSSDWTVDPYTPKRDGNRITGLGSNDAGASVISLISAYEIMQGRTGDLLNLVLVLSGEEEISGKNGIASVLPVLGTIDGAIVGEPTGMHPAIAERGLMVIDAEARGRSGHAARQEGENAIYLAMKDIQAIKDLAFDKQSEWLPDPSAQVTMIESGQKHNVVPDLCKYVIDVRSNDRYSNRDLLALLQLKVTSRLTPRSMRLSSSNLPADHFLGKAIQEAGLAPFGSLTLSDMALMPFPAVKMGPGQSARSHVADEYILLDEIEAGIEGYVNYINAVLTVLKKSKHEVVG